MAFVSTLVDNFDSGFTVGVTWTDVNSADAFLVAADTGRIKVEHSATGGAYNVFETVTTYDYTGSAAYLEVVDFGNQGGASAHEVIFSALNPGTGERTYFSASGGLLSAWTPAGIIGAAITLNTTTHRWLRIRESGGTTFFDTAPDGTTWTNRWSVANPFTMTALRAQASTGCWQNDVTSYALFDNFNTLGAVVAGGNGNFFRFFGPQNGGDVGGYGGGAPAGTPIHALTDLTAVFRPTWTSPAATNAHFQTISTPSGPGFDITCTDSDTTPWDANNKAILAQKNDLNPLGTTETFSFNLFLPSQTLANSWHTGVLWERHTATASGHFLALNSDGTFRIGRHTAIGNNYSYVGGGSGGPAVAWDTWIPIVITIKWTQASDGFVRVSIGGTQYMDSNGATSFSGDGTPNLQYGWYSDKGGLTNRSMFGNIVRT